MPKRARDSPGYGEGGGGGGPWPIAVIMHELSRWVTRAASFISSSVGFSYASRSFDISSDHRVSSCCTASAHVLSVHAHMSSVSSLSFASASPIALRAGADGRGGRYVAADGGGSSYAGRGGSGGGGGDDR